MKRFDEKKIVVKSKKTIFHYTAKLIRGWKYANAEGCFLLHVGDCFRVTKHKSLINVCKTHIFRFDSESTGSEKHEGTQRREKLGGGGARTSINYLLRQ